MTRLAPLLLLGLLGAAVPATAQPVDYCIGRTPHLPDEFEGRDPSGLSLSDALDALLDFELDINGVSSVIGRAVLHAEPRHADQLKAIVEAYHCMGIVESRALVALVFLGEPASYFTSTIERRIDEGNPRVGHLVNALAVRPRAAVLPEYARLRQRAIGTPAEREIVLSLDEDGRTDLEVKVRRDELDRLRPIAEQADFHAERTVVDYVAGGLYNAETGQFTVNELGSAFREDHAYNLDRLREIAQSHPTVAAAAIERWLNAMALGEERFAIPNIVVVRPSAATEDEMYSQEPSPQDLAAVSAYARSAIPVLVPALAATPPVAPLCNGQPATIYVSPAGRVVGGPLSGQPYAGLLTGTPGPDVIVGTDAPDVLDGRSGDDALCGGPADDALDGGPGDDTADGGAGTDGCDAAEIATCEGPVPVLGPGTVRPIVVCTESYSNGGYTLRFGYENTGGQPGRVPAGKHNFVMRFPPGDAMLAEQIPDASPTLFAVLPVGASPGSPAFSVREDPAPTGQTVCESGGTNCTPVTGVASLVWTLRGQAAASDDPDITECPAP